MKTVYMDAILSMFVLTYVFSAWVFMVKQKQGASFVTSFDKAIVRGGCFFVLGSGLSFALMMYGDFSPLLMSA